MLKFDCFDAPNGWTKIDVESRRDTRRLPKNKPVLTKQAANHQQKWILILQYSGRNSLLYDKDPMTSSKLFNIKTSALTSTSLKVCAIALLTLSVFSGCNQRRYKPSKWRAGVRSSTLPDDNSSANNLTSASTLPGGRSNSTLPGGAGWSTLPGRGWSTLPGRRWSTLPGRGWSTLPRLGWSTLPRQNWSTLPGRGNWSTLPRPALGTLPQRGWQPLNDQWRSNNTLPTPNSRPSNSTLPDWSRN